MCDCFHLAFPNWHAASSGTGAGRRLRGPEPGTEDDSRCDEPAQFTEGERPRPQGSSPVEEYPETEIYSDSDKECEAEHDPHHKSGSGKKTKKSGLGSMFEKRSTPKMSKLKEVHSPESGVIVKTAKDGCAEGLIYGGGGKEGIFIKEVVPESPASKSLKLKEGDQVLSATVYFDNMSYEDAIQILEHAQAYKVKLCLKRKPDITETGPIIESDVIPEEDVYAPEMREEGKTKRRGDARISWPKFPSFGKGRKSHFRRSHSSSEADEQRKLELSPTTSDTESPIKSQDALKGKKKHKIKLSVLTKRGRISSSEDQDTDAPTSGQISGNILQTHEASDMLSPECLESPSGETPEVYVTEDLKVVEDLRLEQNDQKLTAPQTVQHKVELISIGNTLKTEDLTVALAGQESPSSIKSPDGKKKKKEKSELKMKILGKDKLHKKDAKAKSSPKRLKTLGASIEIADQLENDKSDVIPSLESHTQLDANTQIISSGSSRVISAKSVTTQVEVSAPKVELDISDVAFVQTSPQKGEEKTKKGKDKQKQETKTGPTFKLPKVGFSGIATEETIQKMNVNVEEYTAKIQHLTTEGTEVKDDPYERLSKGKLSRTKLPKREDIEIPGMEDESMRRKAKGIKEPKAVFPVHYEEIQAETVQLSIDVDSVKEAVSKLPGFKLPKVDNSGMPIPEEITVIDANAQRISVKTPTKVVDTKEKHEPPFTKFDITASPEISKTTVKLPKIAPADLTSEELLIETKVDLKEPEKKYNTKVKQSHKDIKTEVYKREHVIIPGKESAQEEAILQAEATEKTQGTEESEWKSKKITTPSFGIAKPDIKIPNIRTDLPKQSICEQKGDGKGERTIFLQEEKTETKKGKGQIRGVISDVKIAEIDGIEYIDSVDGSPAKKDGGITFTDCGVNLDATNADISFPEIRGEVKDVDAEEHTIRLPKFGAVTPDISVHVPDADEDINIDRVEIKTFEREGKGSKFKMPNFGLSMPKVKGPKIDLSLSKKDIDVTIPEAKAKVKLPEVPEVDVTHGNIDVSLPEQKMEDEKPELEIKPLQTEGELDGQGGKFKMPKFGINMPKIKGPEFDLSLSKKDGDVTLPDVKAEGKLPGVPDTDVTLGNIDVSIPEQKMEVKKPQLEIKPLRTDGELDGQGSKFKMLELAMPKVKGPEVDLSFSKKDRDVPEAIANIKIPGDANISVGMKPPENEAEMDVQGTKFKMPKLGITMPKVKGPEIDFSLSKKDVDVTLPEPKAGVKLPDVELQEPSAKVEIKAPEIKGAKKDAEGSPSKFKMPTFKLPKFGGASSNVSVEISNKTRTIEIPETQLIPPQEGVTVDITAPSVDIEGPSLDVKTTAAELDGKGGKFKMPKFGISLPKVKGPEIDLSLSKTGVDVTLPDANVDVKLPEAPEVDVSLGKADVSLPDEKLEVKKPEMEMQSEVELDGQGGKFKMPKLGMSMPKVKGPEIHFGSSKKDGDVTLPEAKAEVKVPDVEPSVEVEIKAPEIKAAAKGTEGSPSKFKMPTFKLPKFGLGTPTISAEVPDVDKDVKIDEADINIPEEGSAINIAAPSIDIEGPSIDMKTTGTEQDGKGSKFKMPHLGFSMPKVKGPKIDLSLSKKDVDVTLPEAKADVKLPEVDLGKVDVSIPEAKMEVPEPEAEVKLPEAPKIAVEMKQPECGVEMDGHDGKFKIPKFGIKMPTVKGPEFDLSLSKKDADAKLPEVDLGKVDVSIPETKMELKKPELEMQSMQTAGEFDGQGEHFKMPKFGIKMPKVKGPETDMSLSKKDIDVTLPQTKVEVKLSDAPKIDVRLGKKDVLIPGMKAEIEKPELEIKPMQTEFEGQGSKFKMPKFGMSMPKVKGPEFHLGFSKKDVDVTLPEAKADVKLPDVELKEPSAKVEMKAPEIEVVAKDTEGSPFSVPKVRGPDIDLSLSKKDTNITFPGTKAEVKLPRAPKVDASLGKTEVLIPEAKVEVKKPDAKIKSLQTDIEGGGKFKMPKFGITMPKVQGPEIDLRFSKKDADVTLPETKAEVKLPEAPKMDVKLAKVDVSIPEAKTEVKKPQLEIKPMQPEGELDGQGNKYKMPKFGMSMPKVKGPEIDFSLSKKDVDITLPEAKAGVNLPDVELKEPSAEVEIKAPEIEAQLSSVKGSPSKFKMPTFKFPKFGVATPNVSADVPNIDKEMKTDGADIHISVPHTDVDVPKVKAEVHLPEIKVKEHSDVEVDAKLRKPRFSLPRFSFSKPSVKAPEVDVSLPEVNVAIPEGKVEVKGGEVDKKTPECEVEVDGQGSKFKMPKFGITMPKVTGPEIDLNLSKKDVDVTLPEELKKPSAEVEIKAPEIQVATKDTEGSPSKFKMPTFKLPKFGVGMPSATVEVPDTYKDGKVDGADIKIPEEVLTVEIAAPNIDTEGPSIDMKTTGTEYEGKGSKFKMPKFGITMPKVTGPDIDLSLSKKDVDVTLPEAKAEVNLPDVELKEPSAKVEIKAPAIGAQLGHGEGLPSKFQLPTFKLPKFGAATPNVSADVPDMDIKVEKAGLKIPKDDATVDIATQNIDIQGPSLDVKMTGTEGKGTESKFKVPKFGISLPKVQRPEIDASLLKKDVDVKLPEAKAEVKLPEAPKVDVSLGKADVSLPGERMEVKMQELEMQSQVELDRQGGKFKMPKLGMSMPKVKGPEIDLSLSKKDGDVTLPEAKADVKVPDVELKKPSAKVEIKGPEIKVVAKDTEGSPSKFKMPTFKLPKFGVGMPSATVEKPDTYKDGKTDGADIKIPEEALTVDIAAPNIDMEGPSIGMKTTETEHEGKGSKFKIPKFGITMPKVTGPEIDLNVSKKDVDVTLPEAKAEAKVPDVEVKKPSAEVEIKAAEITVTTKDKKGSPSKFKMPTFKLPKFGVGMPSASIEEPNTYKDGKIDGADIKFPEEVLTVEIAAPSIDDEGPSIDMKTTGTEHEGKGSKFKMPKFGITMPKVTGPEIDLSLSKKDVDVALPEGKAEAKVPDVELKKPSAEVEIKAPEIQVVTKDTEGSPSKFKMPTFKLPKFGVGMPSTSVEVPDKDGKIDGADIKIPEEVLRVDIAAPSTDTEGPSIDMKTTGTEHEGKGSKFKMPKFGITMPKVTGPEIDLSLSKKDVDVTIPEAKAEVKVPDVELKKPSAEVEIKAPGIDVQTSNVEGSPSKFKMPTFKLPKFGAATPQVNVEVPEVDKQIKVAGADLKSPETKAEVTLPDVKMKEPVGSISVSQEPMTEGDAKLKKTRFSLPKFSFSKQSTKEVDVSLPDVDVSLPERNVEVKQPEVELKPPEGGVELDRQESKFKISRFGISMPKVKGPEIDLSLSKKDVDVSLPEAKAEVQLSDVKIKQPSAKVEIKAPEIEAQAGNVEGSPSKLKMPTFTLPKFGVATPKISVEVPDVDKDIKIDGAKLEVPKEGATVDVTAPSIDTEGLSVDVKAKGNELEGSGSKFKMPKFGISVPKVKGPEIDLSLSKKDVDVTLPEAKTEVKLPSVEVKEPQGAIPAPDAPKVEVEAKSKRPNWTFPKFSFPRTGGKAPDVDVNLETPKVDVTSPEAKAEVCLPNVEVQGPSGAISMKESPATELDANLKKTTFSLPRFSFAKSSVKEPEVSAELPHVDDDVSLPEGEVIVRQPEMEIKAPELEAERDGQGSKFKLPKFGIGLTKGPEEDLNPSRKDVDITLPEVKAGVKLPEIQVEESSANVEIKASEIEAKSKDVGGSPLKFKMPTVKMPKFGGATYDVTIEAPDADKVAETDRAKLKEDVTVNTKGLSVDIKTDVSKEAITDSETPKTETESVGLGSPSKFKLPSFKMPKLSFSRPKPEDEYVPVETESKEDQLEMELEPKKESKSPKMSLTSFGAILKNIDVEFDVPKTDNVEENLETSKEVHKTYEPSGKQLEAKEKEINIKQDATKSPERTGWFKFPKFGLSSPSEPAKTPEKDKDEKKSPAGETVDEEISPTCSVQSSDAFADISSAMTSEHVGLSLSSPTKVTVKYSDPNVPTGHGEMHSNIITSTTRTELISVEPNLPEKITILSSGVSSSSEDTLRLESGKIHVITSNIQATPEAQHAKLLTAVQVQSAGGLPLQSEANEAASWTVEDSQSGKRTVFERHLVRETSGERSESKETIVITKQITRMLDSSEPISGETASSIQRLKDSVHSEKMRFFDNAEK